jgi:hypothetical protein
MSSTYQVYVPRIKDLRTIALAWYELLVSRGSQSFKTLPKNQLHYQYKYVRVSRVYFKKK